MAAQNALNQALTRIGFNEATRAFLTDIDHEDFEVERFGQMSEKSADNLVKSLMKQGVPGNPVAQLYVSSRAIDWFKTACFIGRHFNRTGRTLDAAFLTTQRLQTWEPLRHAELAHEDPKEPPSLLKPEAATVIAFLDAFPDKLQAYAGTDGRPLSYVIRDDPMVPPEGTDPTIGEPECRYGSIQAEITARATIPIPPFPPTPAYVEDNARVYNILNSAVEEFRTVQVHLKAFSRTRDGRGAWMALKGAYQGDSYLRTLASDADNVLIRNRYTGERRGYTFDTHVAKHKQAHLDLARAGTEPCERDKVRRLLNSIDTPSLQNAVLAIKVSPTLIEDFDASVNFLRAQIATYVNVRTANVSRFSTSPDETVQDHQGKTYKVKWYEPEEFKQLPTEVRDQLRTMKVRRPNRLPGRARNVPMAQQQRRVQVKNGRNNRRRNAALKRRVHQLDVNEDADTTERDRTRRNTE